MPTAEHREETLTINLLAVTVPDLVYRTPTQLQDPREVYEQRETSVIEMPGPGRWNPWIKSFGNHWSSAR